MCTYVLCSIMPTPAQLRCSVYIKHKATIRPAAITPNVQNASQVIKDAPCPCSSALPIHDLADAIHQPLMHQAKS